MKVALDGGTPVTLAMDAAQESESIVVDATSVYFTRQLRSGNGGGAVMRTTPK